ncbi:MAG TPA: MoaD/ThiS family protein [Dehalococcoidia bacterium]|jgi:molybdopterin converting factor small subunit|nr:MoaD/ThiS family protein [Dehalococcoidia bacterium]
MIQVKLMPLLAKRATSRKEQLAVEYRAGLTPAAIAEQEGFHGVDLEPLMAVVNGAQAELDTPLADGDAVELMVGIAGGA